MPARRLPSRAALSLALVCPALAQAAPPWAQVAAVPCRGGAFQAWCFSADSRRLLTGGEFGDLILWDVASGRELRRHAGPGDHAWLIRMHPRDPWAVVVTGVTMETRVWVVLVESGRHHLFCSRNRLRDVAFDATGTHVAFLGEREGTAKELVVYRSETLLAGRPEQAEWERNTDHCDQVVFAPDGSLVVNSLDSHRTFTTDGKEGEVSARAVLGFTPTGERVMTSERIRDAAQVCGSSTVWADEWTVHREGLRPQRWGLPHRDCWWCPPTVAADGTVAIADRISSLMLFGPGQHRSEELTGHAGSPLQMLFSADGSVLAIAGRKAVTFLDVATGAAHELPSCFGVQARRGREFVLVRGQAVWAYDAGSRALTALAGWSTPGPAQVLQWYWAGIVVHVPFLWREEVRRQRLQPGRLWLGGLSAMVTAGNAAMPVPFATGARSGEVYGHMYVSALAPVGEGLVLAAEDTPPLQCGSGLQDVKYWGSLRLFASDGRLRAQRLLTDGVERMRVSPQGGHAVILPGGFCVDTGSLRTAGSAHGPRWVDLAFAGEHTAIATDGRQLFRVEVPSLRTAPLPPLPTKLRDIDMLASSPDGRLLAVSARGTVHVFRRGAGVQLELARRL